MDKGTLKKVARAIDLHGTMILDCTESSEYFSNSKHHVFSLSFPADDETRKELRGFVFYDVGHGYIRMVGEHARGLCREIKPYTAWHKNQIKIAYLYSLTVNQSTRNQGMDIEINEFRQNLVKKFERWNKVTRAMREKTKLKKNVGRAK